MSNSNKQKNKNRPDTGRNKQNHKLIYVTKNGKIE